ncbi:uncharacterized protein LOC100374382 [Saccoglossus kowalevskii]|uniref:Cysteine-rich and transmembrane domain-containing protein 1-like n=1 Tax=Saccoglossus kowalevskii TaxID=10224 RepID=A0ABM0GSP7_SACKO|nr:PREDICTED: cysteine-rich and transmembrane domain-containing protein 1-like [Saccoglossus kowalevskii]
MEQKGSDMTQPPYNAPADAPPPYGQQFPQQQQQHQPPYTDQQYPAQPYPAQPYPAQPYQQSVSNTNVVVSAPQAPQTVVIQQRRTDALIGLDIAGMVMAVWHTFCCFIPLGIAAIIVSAFAFGFRADGKHDTANKLSKVSIGLSIAGFILGVVLIIVIVVLLMNASSSYDYDGYK